MGALDGMLHLVKAEPTLLPRAPSVGQGPAIAQRRRCAGHVCLYCGGPATVAYIVATDAGPRWLDLCAADDREMGRT